VHFAQALSVLHNFYLQVPKLVPTLDWLTASLLQLVRMTEIMQSALRAALVDQLRKSRQSLIVSVTNQAMRDIPEISELNLPVEFQNSVESTISRFIHFIAEGSLPSSQRLDPSLQKIVRSLISRGRNLSTLIMLFHQSHNILEQNLLEVYIEFVKENDHFDLATLLTDMRSETNKFVALRTSQFPQAFLEQAARLKLPGNPDILDQVRHVLGKTTNVPRIDNFALKGRIQAFRLWTADDSHFSTSEGTELSRKICSALETASTSPHGHDTDSPFLIVYPSPSLLWGWCHPGESQKSIDWDAVIPAKFNFVLSPVLEGLDGFRSTHRHAVQLKRLADRTSATEIVRNNRRIITPDHSGALTMAQFVDRLPIAEEMVTAALGPFAKSGTYEDVVRETVRHFLRFGGAGAAQKMNTHRNTVKYRVDRFQESQATARIDSLEVRLALELAHWFGSTILAPEDES